MEIRKGMFGRDCIKLFIAILLEIPFLIGYWLVLLHEGIIRAKYPRYKEFVPIDSKWYEKAFNGFNSWQTDVFEGTDEFKRGRIFSSKNLIGASLVLIIILATLKSANIIAMPWLFVFVPILLLPLVWGWMLFTLIVLALIVLTYEFFGWL